MQESIGLDGTPPWQKLTTRAIINYDTIHPVDVIALAVSRLRKAWRVSGTGRHKALRRASDTVPCGMVERRQPPNGAAPRVHGTACARRVAVQANTPRRNTRSADERRCEQRAR